MKTFKNAAIIHILFCVNLCSNSHFDLKPITKCFPDCTTADLDYSDYNSLTANIASSTDNGLINTWQLYNYSGGSADAFEAILKDWGFVVESETGTNENVSNYAALMCLKKNAFIAETKEQEGQSITAPIISEENIKWYLPASGEFPITDNDYSLEGDYWTSTAVVGSDYAYKYSVGSGTYQEDRGTSLHIRAVRKAN